MNLEKVSPDAPRRLPILATLVVLAAVSIMVALGFWQISRLHQMEAKIARYTAAQAMPEEVAWPGDHTAADNLFYRRSRLTCVWVSGVSARNGRSAAGQTGWAHTVNCHLANASPDVSIVLGWSNGPEAMRWAGGEVRGIIAPGEQNRPRLIADPPLAGLAANARPDPRDLPNNHLSYAVQWFLFATTALVIYGIALRKRLAGNGARG